MTLLAQGSDPIRRIHSYTVPRAIEAQAEKLQRKGFTISEIAASLSYERQAIAQILYWRKARP